VTIRRRPPHGSDRQPCGPVDFKVPTEEDNKPRNILEEIVWYKDVEISEMKEKRSLASLAAAVKGAPPAR
jgi:indole-3-glycerol phosphate synthase